MRFDLKVPFAEKDAAKQLGARWDPARKVWYVLKPDDLAAFAKWSPAEHDAARAAPAPAARKPGPVPTASAASTGNIHVGSRYVAHPVVCDCPPWEVCDRCRADAFAE